MLVPPKIWNLKVAARCLGRGASLLIGRGDRRCDLLARGLGAELSGCRRAGFLRRDPCADFLPARSFRPSRAGTTAHFCPTPRRPVALAFSANSPPEIPATRDLDCG